MAIIFLGFSGYFGFDLIRKRDFHAAWTFMAWFVCFLGSSFVTFIVWDTVNGAV
jgi:hypothetical protein